MAPRAVWLLLWFTGLGCHPFALVNEGAEPSRAVELWEKGQAAMRDGHPGEAVDFYAQSLAADPTMVRNHLSLAAAYLDLGDDAQACPHLAHYVAAQPDHLSIRLHYAELLVRLHQGKKARQEFEQFVVGAQEQGEPFDRNLIHCHSQLMEIAESEDDAYNEHLNRGIGLYLLARERAELPEIEGALSAEGLLCKAAGELTLACEQRPDEARPCWYLSLVWSCLAQQQLELRWLRLADAAAPFSYLTAVEKRQLSLACLQRLTPTICK